MGWVRDQFKNLSEMPQNRTAETPDDRAQRLAAEREVWSRLVSGFQRDVEEFQRLGGSCTLQQPSEIECRISNSSAHITVVVAVDLQAHTVQYSYRSKQPTTAVPDKGVFTLRLSDGDIEMYSSDEHLTFQEARQLILEPLLFPSLPTDKQIA